VTEGRDSTRTVIETFAVDPDDDGQPGAPGGSAIVLSRQMSGFRGAGPASGWSTTTRLSAAVTALTTFPVLVLMAIAISTVFGSWGSSS
jgi:hypothetical protein